MKIYNGLTALEIAKKKGYNSIVKLFNCLRNFFIKTVNFKTYHLFEPQFIPVENRV